MNRKKTKDIDLGSRKKQRKEISIFESEEQFTQTLFGVVENQRKERK